MHAAIVLDAFVSLTNSYDRELLEGILRPYELNPLEAVLTLDKGCAYSIVAGKGWLYHVGADVGFACLFSS